MRHFAQFYYLNNGSYQEQLGSDGILPMDNRWNLNTMECVAREVGRQRRMDGFRIFRCATLLNNPFYLQAGVQAIQYEKNEK